MASLVRACLAGFFCLIASAGHSQPPPSFEAECGGLRSALERLGDPGDRLITIAVRGTLTLAEMNGPIAYMAMCQAPDPRVLCATYGLSGRTAGDEAILTGSLQRVDENHIMLDPCLSSPPEDASAP